MTCDVAIITAIEEEYHAVLECLDKHWRYDGDEVLPNLCAWQLGVIKRNEDEKYSIVIALIAGAGTVNGALVTYKTVFSWRPRYCFFVGIAGGTSRDGQSLGDIVLSETIYGYEYGKLDGEFQPRLSHYERCDDVLRRHVFSAGHLIKWSRALKRRRTAHGLGDPTVRYGPVLSGDKLVDDIDINFFAPVLEKEDRALAIEMEGSGAQAAVSLAKSENLSTSFLMIRSISDMPSQRSGTSSQKRQRDTLKKIAAQTAAEFAVGYIRSGLPQSSSGDGVALPHKVPFIPGKNAMSGKPRNNLLSLPALLLKSIGALIIAQHDSGGVPATEPGQRTGIWTTASTLEAFLVCPYTPLSALNACKSAARFLLVNQNSDGGWPIISKQQGEASNTMATGHAVAALVLYESLVRRTGELSSECQTGIDRGFGWLDSKVTWGEGWPIDPATAKEPRLVATYYALRAYWTASRQNPMISEIVDAIRKAQCSNGTWCGNSPREGGSTNPSHTARAAEILLRLGGSLEREACKSAVDFVLSEECVEALGLGIEQMRTANAGGQTIFHNNSTCDVLNLLFLCNEERRTKNLEDRLMRSIINALDVNGYFKIDVFARGDYSVPALTWPTSEFIYTFSQYTSTRGGPPNVDGR